MIPFNRPYTTGKEYQYLEQAIRSGRLSGNGKFTKMAQDRLASMTGAGSVLLTTSCSSALDMAAILCDIMPGDEVILPSYTFPSTANAFVSRSGVPVFADVDESFPNITADIIRPLITDKTRVIVMTHYAGVPCDLDSIYQLASEHDLLIVEDAAMALGSAYKGRAIGSGPALVAFSFHETKVLGSGEGGCLAVNDPELKNRAEVIWEKGTNRASFQRGDSPFYEWVDLGSSYLPSEIQAAWLWAQLEEAEIILSRRLDQWNRYYDLLQPLDKQGYVLPEIPEHVQHNGSVFFLKCPSGEKCRQLINLLGNAGILAVSHYRPLHASKMGRKWPAKYGCLQADHWSDRLVRLPLFHELSAEDQNFIISKVIEFAKP